MKSVHTAILDTLMNHFPEALALQIADNATEFSFSSLRELAGNIFDYVADYVSEEEARSITAAAIDNV